MKSAHSYSGVVALLEEVSAFLGMYADVRDGTDGPRPNPAMQLMSDVERQLAELKRSPGPSNELEEYKTTVEVLRAELAAICVAVGRSKDGTGYDVDWFELHKDCAPSASRATERSS